MADEVPRQVFQLKDLPTKSVTLYPSRAHVVRELRDVVLQPGQNEIEIFGLTADADENSVQIDGKGAATITDMVLELVPNIENFSDVYPSDSESETEESDAYADSDDEIVEVKKLSEVLKSVELKIEDASERQKSAARRLKTLDAYSDGITGGTKSVKWTAQEVADALELYDKERSELYQVNSEATTELKDLKKKKARAEAERALAGKSEEKRKSKEQAEKDKQRDKAYRQREDRRREANRVRDEKRKFWPLKMYKITLGLETSLETPSNSRRNSLDSITLSGVATADAKGKGPGSVMSTERAVTLSFSYVTNSAFWTPRYDLSISSQQKTATIVYRAEFSNGTSETWKDAKIILSTSQTSYSGLDDKAPTLHSWQVKLGRAYDQDHAGLLSSEESRGPRYQQAIMQQQSKTDYLMKSAPQAQQWSRPVQQATGFQQNNVQSSSMFGNSAATHPLPGGSGYNAISHAYGSANHTLHMATQASAPAMAGFGSSVSQPREKRKERGHSKRLGGGIFGSGEPRADEESSEPEDTFRRVDDNEFMGAAADPEGLNFEESIWEDNGLTANYELPGIRTLAPSSLARRHKIASLNASSILLSHVCVPKLRSAAFLRAKIRNPSTTVTLLKGTAGVTLDGSFLGNMALPRVSPSQLFSLPLGVDPTIQISYPKPIVKRSTQGIFNKEANHVFNRSIWITNTKSSAIELLVLDQVPLSQDERLRIEILQPRGLYKEGDSVRAGQAAKEGGKDVASTGSVREGAWGRATASMKKDGEINWTVNLEKSAACLLKLEYEAKMPSGEGIVGA